MLIPNKDDLEFVTKFPFLLGQPVLAGFPSKGESVSCKEMLNITTLILNQVFTALNAVF